MRKQCSFSYLRLKAETETEQSIFVQFNTQNPCHKTRDFHLVGCLWIECKKFIGIGTYGITFIQQQWG